MQRDLYEVLGVGRAADAATLKAAYRRLAKQYHPDANPGDSTCEAKFREVSEAYAILSDTEKRARYDRFGKAAFEGAAAGPGAGYADFSDIFNEVFGETFGAFFNQGAGAQRGGLRGADLRFDLEITLEEALHGVDKQIRVSSAVSCASCRGSGAAEGAAPQTCPTCSGAGQIRASQGLFRVVRTCPGCGGRGSVVRNPCSGCSGRGVTQAERQLSVKIPAGVEDGTRIRLAGEGDAAPFGGQGGDLYIYLAISPHEIFERERTELYCRATVPMTVAALGGDIEIPTIEGGRTRISIPPGSQTGRRFRIRHAGMSSLRSRERGDLHVEIFVETPVSLSAKQRKLLEEFAAACGEEAHPQSNGFFATVRRFFDTGGETSAR